jgi:hypothetical protein
MPPQAAARSCSCPIAEVPRQNPQCRNQNPLGLLLPHRSAAPTLAHRPLANAPLQADDVPDAAARRARDATQRLERLVHAPSSIKLTLAQIGLVPRARYSRDGQGSQPVEMRDDEAGLEVARSVVHLERAVPR